MEYKSIDGGQLHRYRCVFGSLIPGNDPLTFLSHPDPRCVRSLPGNVLSWAV